MTKEKLPSNNEGDNAALNIVNQQLTSISAENQYVTFQIGEELYGIDIMLVQEIIRYHKPTRVSTSNPVIKGLTNFRGQVIPMIDMHKKFNFKEEDYEYDKFTVVIVFEIQNKTMGIIVDRVSDIVSFRDEDIQMLDKEFEEDVKTKHIKGIANVKEEIVLLLDAQKILDVKVVEKINNEEKEVRENIK